jgi:hypothetical protein
LNNIPKKKNKKEATISESEKEEISEWKKEGFQNSKQITQGLRCLLSTALQHNKNYHTFGPLKASHRWHTIFYHTLVALVTPYHQFFSSSLPTKQNTVAKTMVFVPL